MKRRITNLYGLLLVIISLYGCGELMPSDGRFYVKDLETVGNGMYKYQVVSIKGNNSFWIKDSANKYIVGDTLIVVPLHSH